VPWPGIAAFTHSSHVAVCMSSTLFSNIPTLAPLIVPNSILYIFYPSTIIWQYWKCQQVSNFYGQPSFIDPSGGMEVVVWTVVWTAKPNRALGGIGMRGSLPPPLPTGVSGVTVNEGSSHTHVGSPAANSQETTFLHSQDKILTISRSTISRPTERRG